MEINLTASEIKELAELVGYKVTDHSVSEDLPDDSTVTINQSHEPVAIKDEGGEIAGYWRTVVTFDEAAENGANPIGESLNG